MKRSSLMLGLLFSAFATVHGRLDAQTPDGSEIPSAIPITFGQTDTNIGDAKLAPHQVYVVGLAKGQQFSVVVKTTDGSAPSWYVAILSPATVSVASGAPNADILAQSNGSYSNAATFTLTYQVPTAGNFYVYVAFQSSGVKYSVTVNAIGTPIVTPLPTVAGCLQGQVDYITYSVQLITLDLPDTLSIGGAQVCSGSGSSSCVAKPPLYPQITKKLEDALKSNLPVSACYDNNGNIFQVTLQHQ